MTDFELVTADDVVLMQGLAQRVAAVRPELVNADATYGELAWIWGHARAAQGGAWPRRLWFSDGELVAWGWGCLPYQAVRNDGSIKDSKNASVAYQVHPEHAELIDEVIEWFDSVAPNVDRTVLAGAADAYALARWAAHGYHPDPAALTDKGFWTQFNQRDLSDLKAPVLPEGYRFRTAAEVPPEAVVQAHVEAWHPSAFGLASYLDVLATATYRPDLHVLAEAPDGTMAASATVWLDEVNRVAEFEPVGTHRGHRRLGLGSAVLWHGMRLARDAGAVQMTVACLGRPGNPAREFYHSLGFREMSRDAPLIKPAEAG